MARAQPAAASDDRSRPLSSCWPPGDLFRHRPENHFLNVHQPALLTLPSSDMVHTPVTWEHILAARYAGILGANAAGHIMCQLQPETRS